MKSRLALTGWLCDEKLDELFKLQATQVDFTARQKTFYEITKYIFDQAYWIRYLAGSGSVGYQRAPDQCQDLWRNPVL